MDIDPIHEGIDIDILTLKYVLTPCDLEKMFSESPNAKIINQEDLISKKLSEEFSNAVFAESDEEIPYVPSCECGHLKGNIYTGMTCNLCNTKVSTAFVDHLSHTAWLSIPSGMPKVLHPIWFLVLSEWTQGKKTEPSLLESILNPEDNLPDGVDKVILGQGCEYFYQNCDMIMDYLLNKYPKTKDKKNTPMIREFYRIYKNIMFTTKLPILHNSLHPLVSGSSTLKYADKSGYDILYAIYDLSAVTFDMKKYIKNKTMTPTKRRDMNKLLFNIYKNVMKYYLVIIKDKLSKKPAIVRKHNLGTRCHFSIRMVVVPIVGAHTANEIYLPWKAVVNTYKLEIINVLMNRYNYTFTQAITKHLFGLVQYDKLVHDIMLTLMDECKYKGFPFIVGRNPTLRLYSIMRLFCTRIKTDLADETMSISPLILKGSNTDFDGDELYGQCLKEAGAVEDYSAICPIEAVLDTDSPRISDLVMLSNQALLNMHKFMWQNPIINEQGYELV